MRDKRFLIPPQRTPVRYWRHEDVPGVEFAQTSLDARTFPPRVQSAYAFFYLNRGSVAFTLRGRPREVHAGTLLFISPGEVHGAASLGSAWQAQAAFVDRDIIKGVTYDLTGHSVFPSFQDPVMLTDFAADFVAFWESVAEASSALERESRILILVGDVIETLGEVLEGRVAPETPETATRRAVQNAKARIWNAPAVNVSLGEIAREHNLSPGELRDAFEGSQGVDFATYGRLARLAIGKAYLHEYGLAESAARAGFGADDFLEEFRRVYLIMPEAYRQEVLG